MQDSGSCSECTKWVTEMARRYGGCGGAFVGFLGFGFDIPPFAKGLKTGRIGASECRLRYPSIHMVISDPAV